MVESDGEGELGWGDRQSVLRETNEKVVPGHDRVVACMSYWR